ncbi:hypothetical protein C7B65_07720 [Phormidesmis priestleyi ULC007]|uniref:Uncharacterized protein n=1 Tax=Phormidesmis priestleyi ULC007 TaxID=1920490 RepID=A0A2T1DIN7_9CYAN|nr:hypothetical protein [Phormidesmis priestleyi]PSB20325.1 hypothetical protein C7B65_07720 [Phormidesmis priestleyi ULC007]PZO50194.1 MAG: hypothetical protein DCF14_12350 [Phormidesmis priestleyi]
MDDQVRRPLSVWLTQALFLMVILQFSIALLLMVFLCFSKDEIKDCFSLSRIPYLVGSFGAFLLIGLAFWGLQNRKQYGRWLGAIILVASMVVGITRSHYFQLFYGAVFEGQPLPVPPYKCWETNVLKVDQTSCGYSSYSDLVLQGVLDLFPDILLGFLALRLIFGRAVKRFFK